LRGGTGQHFYFDRAGAPGRRPRRSRNSAKEQNHLKSRIAVVNPSPTILIIEDDDLQYEIYEDALSKYELVRVQNGSEALDQIAKRTPDVVILDHVLSGGELGLDFLPELKQLLPFVPIVIVSGALEVHQQLEALQG